MGLGTYMLYASESLIDDKIGSKMNNLLSLPEPNCTDFQAILRTTNSPNDVKQDNRYKTDQT